MFESLLEKIALALDRCRIPYMIVGGQAVLLHGEPRLTRDIDITLGIGLDRLADVLEMAGSAALTVLVDPDEFTRRTMVLPCRDEESGIRIDFIFSFSPYEQEAISRALTIPMGKAQARFATAEDLVVHKIIAGRPRDLEDARSVLIKNPELDREMVRRVLAEFQQALEVPLLPRFRGICEEST